MVIGKAPCPSKTRSMVAYEAGCRRYLRQPFSRGVFCHHHRVLCDRVKMFSRRSTQENAQSTSQAVRSLARTLIEALLLTSLISVAVRFTVQMCRIEGFSMEPTLRHGQCLVVNKLTYRWLHHPPQRGDIILLKDPRELSREVIKRVIGLPGEKVKVSQGQVYINDRLLNESYISSPSAYTWGPSIVSQGQYFVLGDNRSNSRDSLSWGWLPAKNVIGRAWLSYWPRPVRKV